MQRLRGLAPDHDRGNDSAARHGIFDDNHFFCDNHSDRSHYNDINYVNDHNSTAADDCRRQYAAYQRL